MNYKMYDLALPESVEDAKSSCISALMDGQLRGHQAQYALEQAMQESGQQDWTLYHMIGEAIRGSDVLAKHDAALLQRISAAIREDAPGIDQHADQSQTSKLFDAANDVVYRFMRACGGSSVVAADAFGWHLPAGNNTEQRFPTLKSATPSPSTAQFAEPSRPALALSAEQRPAGRDLQITELLDTHRRLAALNGTKDFHTDRV